MFIQTVTIAKIKSTFSDVRKYCDKYDLSCEDEIAMLYQKLVIDLEK